MSDLRLLADPPTALSDAVWIDPARRDRELVLGDVLRRSSGAEPGLAQLADPETRRRVGYLVDVVQHMRGQTGAEAERLAKIRRALPHRPPRPFWPDERPLPQGTDPIAEQWGFNRGVDLLRLRSAMTRRVDLLPSA